jgi:hypothetical protein
MCFRSRLVKLNLPHARRVLPTELLSAVLPMRSPAPPSRRRLGPSSPRRFDPTQVTQPICPESQPFSVAFTSLALLARDFFTRHSLPTLCPRLPSVLSELSSSIDCFCRQCAYRTDRAPLPSFVDAARSLVMQWGDFVDAIRALEAAGTAPYAAKETHHLNAILNELWRLAAAVKHQDLSVRLKMFEAEVFQCSRTILDSKSVVERLLAELRGICEKEFAVPVRQGIRIKRTLFAECAALLEMLQGAATFDEDVAMMKAQMVEVSAELVALLRKLNLQFPVAVIDADRPAL